MEGHACISQGNVTEVCFSEVSTKLYHVCVGIVCRLTETPYSSCAAVVDKNFPLTKHRMRAINSKGESG